MPDGAGEYGAGAVRRERPRRPLPPHVTMPLLDRVVSGALDEEYAERARARRSDVPGGAASGSPGGGPGQRRGWVAAAVTAAFGLLAASAFVQNTRHSEVDETSRAVLLTRVEAEREALASRQADVGDLQADVVRLERDLERLRDRVAARESQVQRLSLASGFARVRGPGVRIRVDDPPNADSLEVVRDEDLALLVDGLWGAGAEAIAINGKRLSVLSPIRNSGVAIHVNSRPLSPPYVVEAIGDVETLQANLLSSARGNAWFGLADQLGFVYSLRNVEAMTLPAGRLRPLRYAVEGLGGSGRPPEKEAQP